MRAPKPVGQRPQLAGVVLFLFLLPLSCKTTSTVGASSAEPGRDGLVAYLPEALDQAPKLIRCLDTPRPMNGIANDWLEFVRVTLRFVVDEGGLVDPATITRMPSRHAYKGPPSEASWKEAELRAVSCRYEPGRVGDQAVRSLVMRTFQVPTGS